MFSFYHTLLWKITFWCFLWKNKKMKNQKTPPRLLDITLFYFHSKKFENACSPSYSFRYFPLVLLFQNLIFQYESYWLVLDLNLSKQMVINTNRKPWSIFLSISGSWNFFLYNFSSFELLRPASLGWKVLMTLKVFFCHTLLWKMTLFGFFFYWKKKSKIRELGNTLFNFFVKRNPKILVPHHIHELPPPRLLYKNYHFNKLFRYISRRS